MKKLMRGVYSDKQKWKTILNDSIHYTQEAFQKQNLINYTKSMENIKKVTFIWET